MGEGAVREEWSFWLRKKDTPAPESSKEESLLCFDHVSDNGEILNRRLSMGRIWRCSAAGRGFELLMLFGFWTGVNHACMDIINDIALLCGVDRGGIARRAERSLVRNADGLMKSLILREKNDEDNAERDIDIWYVG